MYNGCVDSGLKRKLRHFASWSPSHHVRSPINRWRGSAVIISPPSPAINPPKLVGDLKFIKRSEYLKSKQPAQSPLPLVQLCAECTCRRSRPSLRLNRPDVCLPLPGIGKNPTRFSKGNYCESTCKNASRPSAQLRLPAELINSVLEHLVHKCVARPRASRPFLPPS